MQQHSFFRNKSILILDSDSKKKNDRTWCFWEKEPGIFQDIVYKEWQQIDFYGSHYAGRWDITPYVYKMIRGSDFYNFVFDKIQSWPKVEFLQTQVDSVYHENDRAFVKTESALFSADYVFNSILFDPKLLQGKGSLLQHFMGWTIEADKNIFSPDTATFMDFRPEPPEKNTFVYVLPASEKQALVEYTVFSPALLPKEEYKAGLIKYIRQYLSIENYVIKEEEFGIIPMSTFTFTQNRSSVINIGTAGGQTKGSSGYTFQFIQKQSAAIVQLLVAGQHPGKQNHLFHKRFKLYDDTLLEVLFAKKLTAAQIFSDLFSHNKPQLIFKFLDNETTISEELKIMSSVPSLIFMQAVGKQFLKSFYLTS